jgi:hypothetical protein
MLVGMVTLRPGPAAVGATQRTSSSTVIEAVPQQQFLYPETPWTPEAPASSTWPYESRGAGPAGPPGVKRPDRLSAPEGWTYDPPRTTR